MTGMVALKKLLVCLSGAWLFLASVTVAAPELVLLTQYRSNMDIDGWYMSEKLDGVRAYWNGQRLMSRRGREFKTPDWFTKDFPPFELDGELWSGRGEFEKIQSITSQENPHDGWRQITYHVFEVPNAPGGLLERLKRVKAYLSRHRETRIRVVPQRVCRNEDHLMMYLKQVVALGGEGVVLRNPHTAYETGRVANALKVKLFDDMEGVVVGYRPGKGKYAGVVGALQIELENGQRLYIGSGLKDSDRKNPPALGSWITFRHYGFTERGTCD